MDVSFESERRQTAIIERVIEESGQSGDITGEHIIKIIKDTIEFYIRIYDSVRYVWLEAVVVIKDVTVVQEWVE